ncbi:acyl CoA:acetate/3-ketoacid CoA transferase [Pseudactinotalea suaedae]|uniref:acyl CoA:acetate/3-ketoacid CoA transferase n=1 Tax=Pseudactinotalea suaedae TaxID=1524924 RepID=UPI0012E11AA0|nr:CoA-transferase [Pseudactinotalea suaedae]
MRVVSRREAVELVQDGDALWIGGSGAGHAVPQAFIDSLAETFAEVGAPRGLTTVRVVGIGDFAEVGMSQLALPGLHARTITSNIGNEPRLGAMVRAGEIEAYSFPQGVLSALCREMAAGRPGLVTDVGLGTYVDPRQTGGRQNSVTTTELVEVVELAGREWLFFPALPIDVAVIRASTADEDGNLTMEDEAVHGDSLALAMAAHNNGGLVIAQVARLAQRHSLKPRDVRIPGALVDFVMVEPFQSQTYATTYSPYYAGQLRRPDPAATAVAGEVGMREIIARRSLLEFQRGDICNLGYGVSQLIGEIAATEGITGDLTLTVEQGIFGGAPAGGPDGGAGVNFQAMLEQPSMFDFYDGGGLDIASLSFAEIDAEGNVNVHEFDDRPRGPGGFINIANRTGRLNFVGSLTARGLRTRVVEGTLQIEQEGSQQKLVPRVRQISFSAARAREKGQHVTYITERAVFVLGEEGLVLTEIADGVDLESDVIAQMGFQPHVSPDLKRIDPRVFRSGRMGLAADFAREATT